MTGASFPGLLPSTSSALAAISSGVFDVIQMP
jgi:hypothetical protein